MPDNKIADIQRRDYKKRTPREMAYHAIDSERDYQDKKYPGTNARNGRPLEGHVRLMRRYADRLDDITLEGHPEIKTLILLRKLAAIAVRAMEDYGAPVRE